jgi:O-methyltransferase
MIAGVQKLTREILFHTPLKRYFFPKYLYNFTPPQLCFLCQCIEETKHVAGSLAEVGCANGLTTIFLNKYMTCQNIEKVYYTIDTFSGFVADDVRYEVTNRGKTEKLFKRFQVNKKKWFDGTMRSNDISRVRSFEADINKFDVAALGPLSFVLLDVDLYRPIKKALPELFEMLSPGGILIVDDCDPLHIRWDGSDQAYKEFMKELNQPSQVMHGKLGVIRKPV